MGDAFITTAATELPGPPVSNDDIEGYLGVLREDRGRLRRRVLESNGIVTRHYAIDPKTGEATHNQAQMQALAIRRLLSRAGLSTVDIDLLSCSTAIPDLITPGIASMVHGELGGHPLEIATAGGVCASSMTAFKYATMAVRTGEASVAVVGGSERLSASLRARFFQAELDARKVDESDPHIGLGAEFLRFMLSDGAGCVLLQPRPSETRISLRVEWVQLVSYAHELPTCMYMGGKKLEDGTMTSWRDAGDLNQAVREGYFNLTQDVGLLQRNIIPVTVTQTIQHLQKTREFTPNLVDWVLPHFSSELFAERALAAFRDLGFRVADSQVRSNLAQRGNVGSASIFVMIDELLESGDLRPGDGVLVVVPESGRFNTGYALLRAVGG